MTTYNKAARMVDMTDLDLLEMYFKAIVKSFRCIEADGAGKLNRFDIKTWREDNGDLMLSIFAHRDEKETPYISLVKRSVTR